MLHGFRGFYRGKKALVTGHTGFKGSWLSMWLNALGCKVKGYALDAPTHPSNFAVCELSRHTDHFAADVRDKASLNATMQAFKPDVVFHLAAQPLVRASIRDPHETFETNIMGTVNLLEAALACSSVSAVVSITSDKCYRNVGWCWGYRETDTLGGNDPYSASKASAELVISVYQNRAFQAARGRADFLPIASARAGNVFGGGDWASERLIPDVVQSIRRKEPIVLRSPHATRPWQHVFEPLSGYLWLGANLASNNEQLVSGWNFGPVDLRAYTVKDVVEKLFDYWPSSERKLLIESSAEVEEAKLLALDCSKAMAQLQWSGTWSIDEALRATVEWYRAYYDDLGEHMRTVSENQIERYSNDAYSRGQPWANEVSQK